MKGRGFAALDPERRKELARMGGHAAHAQGRAREWSSAEAREKGKKGGASVSRNREHMAAIGRKGGAATASDREHMVELGKKSYAARHAKGGS